MATFKNFDPGRIGLMVAGQLIQGIAPGTFVKVSRTTKTFSTKAGAGGDVVRTKSRDRRGTIELTLMAESPSNDYLSGLVATDEQVIGGTGAVGASFVKDLNGTTLCSGANSWVCQPADVEYGDESGNRTWLVECSELLMLVGGSLV